jgi:hypothetical protein
VAEYLNTVGGAGPTNECLIIWWATVAAYVITWFVLYQTGSYKAAIFLGYLKALFFGFGHNWVH